jgi:farnesyl diphosphate synthase
MAKPILEFEQWVSFAQTHIEDVLDKHMPSENTAPTKLHSAMRYAVLGGGKRVRALLAYATGEFFNAPKSSIDLPAAAVELIHAFSLVEAKLRRINNLMTLPHY